jgi:heme-degrading monooxygenase HmoA
MPAMRYVTLAIHYPKSDKRKELLDAMTQLAKTAKGMPGLIEMSSWVDEASDRIFALSLWESKEECMASWQKLGPVAAQFPFADWERQTREVFMDLVQGA